MIESAKNTLAEDLTTEFALKLSQEHTLSKLDINVLEIGSLLLFMPYLPGLYICLTLADSTYNDDIISS